MLLKAGANVHAEDAQGYTPQDDAEVAPFGTGPKKKVQIKLNMLIFFKK
jgi:hypothetical protein